MIISIDTSDPLNPTDRAVLLALINRIPADTPEPEPAHAPHAGDHAAPGPTSTPPHAVPAQPHTAHTTPPPIPRPAFNPTNPIPPYSARAQIANQPGVTIRPTTGTIDPPETTEAPITNPATAQDTGARGTSDQTGEARPDETSPAS